VAVTLAQIWSACVEQLRLRDDHISYRAFELPASRHGWVLWASRWRSSPQQAPRS
jgi:hypothetical protein